jgi:hypothetical protein
VHFQTLYVLIDEFQNDFFLDQIFDGLAMESSDCVLFVFTYVFEEGCGNGLLFCSGFYLDSVDSVHIFVGVPGELAISEAVLNIERPLITLVLGKREMPLVALDQPP